MRKDSKVAIIFGASSGLGAACARLLAQKNFSVIAFARRQPELAQLAEESGAVPITGDVSDPRQVNDAFALALDRFGRVDVVINTASVFNYDVAMEEISDQEWQTMRAINIDGAFYVARASAAVMRPQKSGVVVTISSLAGLWPYALAHRGHYTATKHAQVGLMATLSAEMKEYGGQAFAVCPGLIEDTPMVADFLAEHPEWKNTGITTAAASQAISQLVINPETAPGAVLILGTQGLQSAD